MHTSHLKVSVPTKKASDEQPTRCTERMVEAGAPIQPRSSATASERFQTVLAKRCPIPFDKTNAAVALSLVQSRQLATSLLML